MVIQLAREVVSQEEKRLVERVRASKRDDKKKKERGGDVVLKLGQLHFQSLILTR